MRFQHAEKNSWVGGLTLCNPTQKLSQEDCHMFTANPSKSETLLKPATKPTQYRAGGNQMGMQGAVKVRLTYKEISVIGSKPWP